MTEPQDLLSCSRGCLADFRSAGIVRRLVVLLTSQVRAFDRLTRLSAGHRVESSSRRLMGDAPGDLG